MYRGIVDAEIKWTDDILLLMQEILSMKVIILNYFTLHI